MIRDFGSNLEIDKLIIKIGFVGQKRIRISNVHVMKSTTLNNIYIHTTLCQSLSLLPFQLFMMSLMETIALPNMSIAKGTS